MMIRQLIPKDSRKPLDVRLEIVATHNLQPACFPDGTAERGVGNQTFDSVRQEFRIGRRHKDAVPA